MKTVLQIVEELKPYKPVTYRQVHRYLKRFKIQRCGVRQNPDLFPDESADKILNKLGLKNGGQK